LKGKLKGGRDTTERLKIVDSVNHCTMTVQLLICTCLKFPAPIQIVSVVQVGIACVTVTATSRELCPNTSQMSKKSLNQFDLFWQEMCPHPSCAAAALELLLLLWSLSSLFVVENEI